MKRGHLTRRPISPEKRFTWARIPMGDTGMVCYRLFRCDASGAQHMQGVDIGSATTRRSIASKVRVKRNRLISLIASLEAMA